MKPPVATDSSCVRSPLRRPLISWFPVLSLVGALGLLAGCPGTLDGFPPPDGGSSSGTGGSQNGSGGSSTGGSSGSGGSNGSGGSSGSGGSAVVCDAPTKIFKDKCGSSSCHSATGPFQPNLITPPVENAIIGKAAVFGCSGNLVNSSGPVSGSVFMKRITSPDCTDQMPMNADPLSSDDVKCVSDWLASKIK